MLMFLLNSLANKDFSGVESFPVNAGSITDVFSCRMVKILGSCYRL
jgi:hypothetical protein